MQTTVNPPAAGRHWAGLPAGIFAIAFGLAQLGGALGWDRLRTNTADALGLGSGPTTILLAVGKCAQLALVVLVAIALVRRRDGLLLTTLAGWTLLSAALTAVAAVGGAMSMLAEYAVPTVIFAALTALLYRARRPAPAAVPDTTASDATIPDQPPPDATLPYAPPKTTELPRVARTDVRVAGEMSDKGPPVTRQDLPVRRPSDVTREERRP